MTKQITITVTAYALDELTDDNARRRAVDYVASRMYDNEQFWMNEAIADFENNVSDPDGLYRCEELPESDSIQSDFKESYKYFGARKGAYIRNDFREFCNDRWDNLLFDDEEISDYANEFEMLFSSDGTLVSEDGELVRPFA